MESWHLLFLESILERLMQNPSIHLENSLCNLFDSSPLLRIKGVNFCKFSLDLLFRTQINSFSGKANQQNQRGVERIRWIRLLDLIIVYKFGGGYSGNNFCHSSFV